MECYALALRYLTGLTVPSLMSPSKSLNQLSLVSRPRPYIEKCKVVMDKRNGIRLIATKPRPFSI